MPDKSSKAKTENKKTTKDVKKGTGIRSLIFTIFLIFIIIAVIFGGGFYYVIHNNINGIADRYREKIQNIPLAKLALPEPPDLLDPRYMTEREIKQKYIEFKEKNELLEKQISDMNAKLNEYQAYIDDFENQKQDMDKQLQEIKKREADMDLKDAQLQKLKTELDKLIANGDRESFKEYYETLDRKNAELIYSEVVKELQVDSNTKKFAQVFEAMEPAAAAVIFEQLGESEADMTAETLKAMKKESSAAILEAMTPAFAAKITEKLKALFSN